MDLWDEALKSLLKEGRRIGQLSLKESIRASDMIRCRPINKKKAKESRVVSLSARKHLILAAQLMNQILDSLKSGHLLLGLIGLRVLTEEAINAKYIFDHPKFERDYEHAYRTSKDLIDRSHQSLVLSKLDNKTIEIRARQTGLIDLYEKEYIYLCQFSHGMLEGSYLHEPYEFKTLTASTLANSIGHSQFIRESIGNFFDISHAQKVENRTLKFGSGISAYLEKLAQLNQAQEA